MAMAEAKAKPVKKEEARVRNIAAVSLPLVSALQLTTNPKLLQSLSQLGQ
jgi:hypothetical protein